MYRILSIDGGGIRGLIPIIVLKRLTQTPGLGVVVQRLLSAFCTNVEPSLNIIEYSY